MVKRDILNKVIIDNWTDLISYPYCSVLDIKKLHLLSRKVLKKTKFDNLYDNNFNRELIWEGSSSEIQRAIQDMS